MAAPVPKTVGTPVNQSTPIGEWTTDDLADFIRQHIAGLPPEALPQSSSWDTIHVGNLHIAGSNKIRYPGMSPIVVSSFAGPGLLNGYVDAASPNARVQFYKDAFGIVHLHGATVNGSGTVGSPMFNLIPGYRPDVQCVFFVPTDSNSLSSAPLIVSSNGDVTLSAGTRTSAYLSGVKFPTRSNA